jgi:hypothetical protein
LWIKVQAVPIIAWSCGDEEFELAVDDIEVWSEGNGNANR